ncbi:MAG: PstS family phosphate ABC transporter substrate-binding protein [Melioribacteraceae bacterium]
MVNLTLRWAEGFMEEHSEISVQVTGGGSGTGIASLINGTSSIANISRELKQSEINYAKQNGVNPIQHIVALDGIAVIVNPSNKIDAISFSLLKDIYSGKVKNWKTINGNDANIVLYGRENSSGTYEYFRQSILGRNESGRQIDFPSNMQSLQGTASLAEAVSKDKNGIGFGGVGYFALRNDIKVLPISYNNSDKAIPPVINNSINYDAIRNGSYPLSRFLYSYTNGIPKGEEKLYIDFILSYKGQKIVESMEYIPLKKN